MQKFELTTPTQVKLEMAKGRKEFHGEALVLALDLKLSLATNNNVLDQFDPQLRHALFSALPPGNKPPENQAELDLPVSDLSFINLARVEYPLKLDLELKGYTLRLDYGMGGEKSDTVVKLCALKNFKVTPIAGGSVEIEFSVSSAADIDGATVGKFSALIQENITITLLAPNEVENGVIDASAGSGAPGTTPDGEQGQIPQPEQPKPKGSRKNSDATDAFIAQHGAQTAH